MTGIIQIINNFERNSKYMQIVLPLSYCKKKKKMLKPMRQLQI